MFIEQACMAFSESRVTGNLFYSLNNPWSATQQFNDDQKVIFNNRLVYFVFKRFL
jgi:hypothetical protein